MKNPKIETLSGDSNSGPHDCKAYTLPHDHGHHRHRSYIWTVIYKCFEFRPILTLYHTILTFNDPEKEAFKKKTLWEKEKMLVASIVSFSHNVLYPSQKEFLFLSNIYFVACKCFQFGLVSQFVIW